MKTLRRQFAILNNMDYLKTIAACVADMEAVKVSGKYTLEAQVRAYDLLSSLLEDRENGVLEVPEASSVAFKAMYEECSETLNSCFDEKELKDKCSALLKPLETAANDARFNAASAASLHEFAKETFHTWQTAGIFARRRALKALRERAGFRLEQDRIGNYVAKTFDLMNEAASDFAKAQQVLFSADVTYKIQPGIYEKIAGLL